MKTTLTFKTYQVIERAVEEGINYGYRKAHKHTDNPGEENLKQLILDAIMQHLDEIVDF